MGFDLAKTSVAQRLIDTSADDVKIVQHPPQEWMDMAQQLADAFTEGEEAQKLKAGEEQEIRLAAADRKLGDLLVVFFTDWLRDPDGNPPNQQTADEIRVLGPSIVGYYIELFLETAKNLGKPKPRRTRRKQPSKRG